MALSDIFYQEYSMEYFSSHSFLSESSPWSEQMRRESALPDYVSCDGTHHYNLNCSVMSDSTTIPSRDSSPGVSSTSSRRKSDDDWRGREVVLPGGQRVFILANVVNCERNLRSVHESV